MQSSVAPLYVCSVASRAIGMLLSAAILSIGIQAENKSSKVFENAKNPFDFKCTIQLIFHIQMI